MLIGIEGLFPAGEGAGYAGGIVSSAVDGMLAAGRIGGEIRRTGSRRFRSSLDDSDRKSQIVKSKIANNLDFT